MKKILILGSTGSIGVNCLEVIKNLDGEFKVTGLTTNSNVKLLLKQIEQFNPKVAVVSNENAAHDLAGRIPATCELLVGDNGFWLETTD
jgi:1-deoxy-D-xylulose-5-phosphate reductoisomerase